MARPLLIGYFYILLFFFFHDFNRMECMEPYAWRRIYTFCIRQPTSQRPVGSSLVIPKSPQVQTVSSIAFYFRILIQKDKTDNKVFQKELYTKEIRKKGIEKIKRCKFYCDLLEFIWESVQETKFHEFE